MKQPVSSRQRALVFRKDPKAAMAASRPGKPDETKRTKDKTKRRHYLRQYMRWLWPYRGALAALLGLALLAAALDMIWPLAIQAIINMILGTQAGASGGAGRLQNWMRHLIPPSQSASGRLGHLDILGAGILVMLVSKQLIDSFRSYRTAVLNAKVIFR